MQTHHILVLFLLFFTKLAFSAPTTLVISTDLDCDDRSALQYLSQQHDVKILAITLLAIPPKRCADLIIAYRQLAQQYKIHSPYACHNRQSQGTNPTQQLIKRALERAKQPVTLLAIAPLTDFATSLQHQTKLWPKIKRMFIMGGTIHSRGNAKNGDSEWNFAQDPLAAKVVLQLHVPKILLPLDLYRDKKAVINQLNAMRIDYDPKLPWDPIATRIARRPKLALCQSQRIIITHEGRVQHVHYPQGYNVSICTKFRGSHA